MCKAIFQYYLEITEYRVKSNATQLQLWINAYALPLSYTVLRGPRVKRQKTTQVYLGSTQVLGLKRHCTMFTTANIASRGRPKTEVCNKASLNSEWIILVSYLSYNTYLVTLETKIYELTDDLKLHDIFFTLLFKVENKQKDLANGCFLSQWSFWYYWVNEKSLVSIIELRWLQRRCVSPSYSLMPHIFQVTFPIFILAF